MEGSVFEAFAIRLGISSKRIVLKAQELNRLACVRTSCAGPQALFLSSSCEAVICLDLAAAYANMTVNKDLAIRLAGVRKKVYENAYVTYERILELQSNVTVRDIALRFGCMQAIDLAQQVLRSYEREMKKRLSASVCEGLDLSQPMFAAAAVCATCKKMKIRLDKRKLIDIARVRKPTFDKLSVDMERHAEKLIVDSTNKNGSKKLASTSLLTAVQNIDRDESPAKRRKISLSQESDDTDGYEEWKRKILEQTDADEVLMAE